MTITVSRIDKVATTKSALSFGFTITVLEIDGQNLDWLYYLTLAELASVNSDASTLDPIIEREANNALKAFQAQQDAPKQVDTTKDAEIYQLNIANGTVTLAKKA